MRYGHAVSGVNKGWRYHVDDRQVEERNGQSGREGNIVVCLLSVVERAKRSDRLDPRLISFIGRVCCASQSVVGCIHRIDRG
jgi:hypothetical protein